MSAEHGLAAAGQRHRGGGFVESALPPRVGDGVAVAPVADAGDGGGAGTDAVADLGMETVKGSGVVVAAAGVTVDSSAENPIDSLGAIDLLDPIDPLRSKRRPREQARGVGEGKIGEQSVDGGVDDAWEIENSVDGGTGNGGGGGGSGVGAPLGDAGDGLRTGDTLSGEEAANEAPVDTERGATPFPAVERAPQIGEERAHKMWVTMGGGATVLGKSGASSIKAHIPKREMLKETNRRTVLQVNRHCMVRSILQTAVHV